MQSAKSGVSRVLGLPAKLISVPKATIRGCHVLTVTECAIPNTRGFISSKLQYVTSAA
jgi:hypothetical protein